MFCLAMFNLVVKYEELHFPSRKYCHYIFEMGRQHRIIVCGPTTIRFVRCFTLHEKAFDGVRLFFAFEKSNNVIPDIGNHSRIAGGIVGIVVIWGTVVKRQAVTWIVMSCLAGEVRVQQVVHLLLKNFWFYQHRLQTMWRFTFSKCFIWSKISTSLHTNCFIPRYPRFF